jgi:adenylylsulfate kinase-like enzyme
MQRKILIMGLPGAGKTTLANTLAPLLNAVVFNADAVRANLSRDLGFSHKDRVEHARRMGWMCDRVVEAGGTVIADFVCPTAETRAAFGESLYDLARSDRRGPLRRHQPYVRSAGSL